MLEKLELAAVTGTEATLTGSECSVLLSRLRSSGNQRALEVGEQAEEILAKEWKEADDEVRRLRSEQSAALDALAALLREVGLGDHARPQSPAAVLAEEIMPAVISLRAKLTEWEEREAACCPEDVGFPEYIAHLRSETLSLRRHRDGLSEAVDNGNHKDPR